MNHYDDDDELEPRNKASVFQRIGSFFSLHEDEEFEEPEEPGVAPRRNVVQISAPTKRGPAGSEVGLFAPRGFADVTEIADALRARQVVILNLQSVDRALLQRIVDFTSGVAYTLDGKIQKLADAMYLVVPPGIAVNSDGIRATLADDPSFSFLNRG
jgi:cell division inhibitor SepF